MRKLLGLAIGALVLLAPTAAKAQVKELHLWGVNPDGGNDIYLGCITCQHHDAKSIYNPNTYGSRWKENSIYYEGGKYGSIVSDLSACSIVARNPPRIRSERGKLMGLLTSNRTLVNEEYRFNPKLLDTCNQFK